MLHTECMTIRSLQVEHNEMAFVIVVVFINIQLIIDAGLSQSNQQRVYENKYVRNAAIYVFVRIAQ